MSKKEKIALEDRLAKALLKIRAIRAGTFETSDGKMTSYFIDLKNVPSFPNVFSLALDCFALAISEIEKTSPFECFCGVRTTGLVFASGLAVRTSKPLIFPVSSRQPEKGLRGFIAPGTKVIVIDDVSETGLSMKSAVLAVRSAGGVAESALTLIDRLESAAKILKGVGVRLHSFTTVKELGSAMRDKMAMTEEEESAMESVL